MEKFQRVILSRRQFAAVLISCGFISTASAEPVAGRTLDFQIDAGFGHTQPADIKAVLRSAGESIWRHCPRTRWELPGFYIFHRSQSPITLDEHRPDGRIAIGLTPKGNYWSQFAFQFAHEFCHALARHSNDWRKPCRKGRQANLWLEESICETASLFALRSMGQSWKTAPPYPNWKDYAPNLTQYAADRIDNAGKSLPRSRTFAQWFAENQPAMRMNAVMRAKNEVVALQLLPIFEAHPAGWEAMPYLNLGKHDPDKSLAVHFAEWTQDAPSEQRKFIERIARVFGL